MSDKKKTESKRPVQTVRDGAVGASIWLETGAEGAEYYAITFSRAWKSKLSGKQGYSSKFFARNRQELHAVVDAACDAVEAIERGQSESSSDSLAA